MPVRRWMTASSFTVVRSAPLDAAVNARHAAEPLLLLTLPLASRRVPGGYKRWAVCSRVFATPADH